MGVNRHEGIGKLSFFIYENGKLKDGSSYMPDTQNIQVSDFFDDSYLDKQKEGFEQFFKEEIAFRYVLPQKGKSIEMCIGFPVQDQQYVEILANYILEDGIVFKHIVFKWVDEKWVKEVHKGEGTRLVPYP